MLTEFQIKIILSQLDTLDKEEKYINSQIDLYNRLLRHDWKNPTYKAKIIGFRDELKSLENKRFFLKKQLKGK